MPAPGGFQGLIGDWLQGMPQIGVDIQVALQVVLVESVVATPVTLRFYQTQFAGELPPGVIAVAGEQGMVQVKNCEGQGVYSSQ